MKIQGIKNGGSCSFPSLGVPFQHVPMLPRGPDRIVGVADAIFQARMLRLVAGGSRRAVGWRFGIQEP